MDDTLVSPDSGGMPLESVLCTEELRRRPSRPPQYEKQNHALTALARALADSPATILQKLADTILELLGCGSAGVSLLTVIDGAQRFYWPAIAGRWKPNIGSGTPRDFGPCGDVLDHDKLLLFRQFQRRYTYFEAVMPQMEEALLAPFRVNGKAVGTIWAVAHDESRKFDAEDERLLMSLATFASSAYQMVTSLDVLRQNQEQLLRNAEMLEQQVRLRTEQLENRATEVSTQAEQLRQLWRRLQQAQDDERRHVARELHDSIGQTLVVLALTLDKIRQHAGEGSSELVGAAAEGREIVRDLGDEIHTMSYLLHPPLLDEEGLSFALGWYVDGLAKRSTLQIRLDIPESLGRFSAEMELTIFRLVQECLTNIHRHAECRNAVIRIVLDEGMVALDISDDGKGIPLERLAEIRLRDSGVGIRAMRERVLPFGGTMNIESNGSGTTIRFTLSEAKQDLAKPATAS